MRKLFFSLLLIALFTSSCHDQEEVPSPAPDAGKAHFKLIYTQTGDLDIFSRAVALGSGFVYLDTGEEVPNTLFNDDLPKEKYIFVTKEPVREIEVGITIGWIYVPEEVKAITASLEIYRNDTLIDSQIMEVTSEEEAMVFQKKYEAE